MSKKLRLQKPSKHIESAFNDIADGEPASVNAFKDCIQLHVFMDGEDTSRIVTLRPKHILAIKSMYEYWWESDWARVHEEEA